MHYVYLIRSESHPDETYIGLTSDLRARIAKHNEGGSPHTANRTTPPKIHSIWRCASIPKAMNS